MLQGLRISRTLGFANFQNQRDRSPVVTLFFLIEAKGENGIFEKVIKKKE